MILLDFNVSKAKFYQKNTLSFFVTPEDIFQLTFKQHFIFNQSLYFKWKNPYFFTHCMTEKKYYFNCPPPLKVILTGLGQLPQFSYKICKCLLKGQEKFHENQHNIETAH